jgi:predicted small integral membrane protein
LSKSEVQALLAGPTRLAFLACALFFLVGVVLFSAASLRAGVFPRLAVVLYLIGFTVYSLYFFLPNVVVVIAEVGGAVGIIWLGYALWIAIRKTAAMP